MSQLAKGLDEQVEAWNERPLDGSHYPFVLVDAMHIKVRRQGAVRSTSALIAVGINEAGYREILGLRIANSETEEGLEDAIAVLRLPHKYRRLLGASLAETHEDWSTGRRYFRMDSYFRWHEQQQAAKKDVQPAA